MRASMERECAGGFMSTSLHKAARYDDAALVEAALDVSASQIDAVDAKGRTALMIAAQSGHGRVARALLKAGCDVDARDSQQQTAEDVARGAGHAETAEFICAERRKRDGVWAALFGLESKPAAREDDALAKILAQAGLQPTSRESPF
ncbi:ankyrin repeat-containing domain protein [Pelagophyceae sp. CCMP2097]|nr:ankyrin repeat-containing domain protein [Pelagophyceae sp. CCMP2097]